MACHEFHVSRTNLCLTLTGPHREIYFASRDCYSITSSASASTFAGMSIFSAGVLGYVSGINWQTGQYVYGLEQTLSWARIRGSTGSLSFPVPPAGFVPTGIFDSELQWYGTAESRFGMMF